MKKRVFVCGLHEESNCFNPVMATEEAFSSCRGEAIPPRFRGTDSILGGIVDALEGADVDAVYGPFMSAPSGAPLDDGVPASFTKQALADLCAAGRIDGVLLAMHGATMSATSDDVCGDVIEAIRQAVGEEIPIAAGFDLHANITEKIAEGADYICGYLTYPHIDQNETGRRATRLLLAHLQGERACTAHAAIPMIAPAHGYTTSDTAFSAFTEKAKEMIASGRILDYTVFEVQPWLDAKSMAATVIAVAKDEKAACDAANELARMNFEMRDALLGEPLEPVDTIIARALTNKSGKPIILVDSADSRGAGSTADSAFVIEKLLPYRDTLCCAVSVSDAPAVERAFALGVGACADFMLGATVAPSLSHPAFVQNARVKGLHDGAFRLFGPAQRGQEVTCGRVAVLEVGKIQIQVSSLSDYEGDLNFYQAFGILPEKCDLVSVKACTSFRAGYAPIAAEICTAQTPGAAGTDLTALPYSRRPVPLYPFEAIGEEDLQAAKCYR